jgi:ABC-type bacteriocin/lantibiotic exporter with double-glycine peptidase domain
MKIIDFPELKQSSSYDCGALAIQSVLNYYGIDVREDLIIKNAKTSKEDGTPIKGIINVLKKYKLKCVAKKMDIDELIDYIEKDVPVILLLQAWWNKKNIEWEKTYDSGHYVVAIGYDSDRVYFEDPYKLQRTYLEFLELKKRWHSHDDDLKKIKNFAIAVIGQKKEDYKKIIPMK